VILRLSFLILIHVLAALALFSWDLKLFAASVIWWQVTGAIGVSVCLHRQLTHRSFDSHPSVLVFHLILAQLAGQAGPLTWASVHRAHHKYSDTPLDPHSPLLGFWHAHWGWLFNRKLRESIPELKLPLRDLEQNKWIRFFEKFHWHGIALQFIVLFLLGGWPWVLWLWGFRLFIILNSSWAVNSIGHVWGYRNHETGDLSKNNLFLAILTAGEGYHNNHHSRPHSPIMAHRKGEFDPGGWYVKLLVRLGLAKSKWLEGPIESTSEKAIHI
jgi:fatty-acid desaturase